MDQNYFQVLNYDINGRHLAIMGGTLILLAVIKSYCSGGKCKIEKDLTGKVAVITGGNTGIGRQTAIDLAKKNCDIIIGARDKGKLQETIKQLHKINPKIKTSYSVLDLGDKQSIQHFAQFVLLNCQKIDFLINNAGVMMVPERRQTKDGLQMQIGINHFGHYLLTYLLFEYLKKSQYFRIVNVSSRAHLRTKGIDFTDINSEKSYNDIDVYSKSKLANIYFTRLLQKKINSANLKGAAFSLHPGVVRTQLMRYIAWYKIAVGFIFLPIYYLLTKNCKQGAQTTLYTVLEDISKLTLGQYYSDCHVGFSTQISKNLTKAEQLWKVSQQTWKIRFDI